LDELLVEEHHHFAQLSCNKRLSVLAGDEQFFKEGGHANEESFADLGSG
jgi:hypothetical protein